MCWQDQYGSMNWGIDIIQIIIASRPCERLAGFQLGFVSVGISLILESWLTSEKSYTIVELFIENRDELRHFGMLAAAAAARVYCI